MSAGVPSFSGGGGGGGGGQSNTASNVGTAGVGVFKQKSGVDLEFKKVNAGSSKVTVTDDVGNDEVDVDVAEGNVDHDALLNFVADEHVPHSTIDINTSEGIQGGGTIAADRTLTLDINGLTADATPDIEADYVATYDANAATHKKVLIEVLAPRWTYIIDSNVDTIPTPGAGIGIGEMTLLDTYSMKSYLWDPSVRSSSDTWLSVDADVYAVSGQTSAPGSGNQQAVHHNVTTSPRDRGRVYEDTPKIITEASFTTDIGAPVNSTFTYEIYIESSKNVVFTLNTVGKEEWQDETLAIEVAKFQHVQHFLNVNGPGPPFPTPWNNMRWFAQCWLRQQLDPT